MLEITKELTVKSELEWPVATAYDPVNDVPLASAVSTAVAVAPESSVTAIAELAKTVTAVATISMVSNTVIPG